MSIGIDDLQYIAKLVLASSAIVLDDSKDYLVEAKLIRLLRTERVNTFGELVKKLKSQPDSHLRTKVIDALTTNETSFFRDSLCYGQLREKIFPQLLTKLSSEKSLSVWSAACSSGQEPYSIAMLLDTYFKELVNWNVQIIASDISEAILAKAEQGRFNQVEINRGLSNELRSHYFEKSKNYWIIDKKLRDQVDFKKFNLLDSFSVLPKFDLILLRNVLIYFSAESKKAILLKLSKMLKPGGVLMLGASEIIFEETSHFIRRSTGMLSYYQVGK